MLGQRTLDPAPRSHYRSDRISAVNGQYFFATREGTLEGPYFTRVDAAREVGSYIQRQLQALEIIEKSRTRDL